MALAVEWHHKPTAYYDMCRGFLMGAPDIRILSSHIGGVTPLHYKQQRAPLVCDYQVLCMRTLHRCICVVERL